MSGYIGNIPTPQATQTRQSFTATASQTSFATAGYTPGFVDVFLNGVHLLDGTDYTASNGSDIVLTTGAASGDTLEVVAYSTFQLANQSFTGDFSVDSPTFVVDSTNNRVGIGTASPSYTLDVSEDGGGGSVRGRIINTGALAADVSILQLQVGGTSGENLIYFGDSADSNAGTIRYDHSADDLGISVNAAERLNINSSGDLNLLTGQLLMAGNTTYQILNVYYGADSTTYSTSSTTSSLGGVMSTSVGITPTTSTSKLIVAWRARSNIRRTSTTGNDARGDLVLRWYDGTTYSGNQVANFSSQIGMVNTIGTGGNPQLIHYAVPVITSFIDQTKTRSDTGTWTLRLYGNCDYADNELTTENISYLLIEVDNGT